MQKCRVVCFFFCPCFHDEMDTLAHLPVEMCNLIINKENSWLSIWPGWRSKQQRTDYSSTKPGQYLSSSLLCTHTHTLCVCSAPDLREEEEGENKIEIENKNNHTSYAMLSHSISNRLESLY